MYYLPILIDRRRMHVMHLDVQEEFEKITLPTFIINNKSKYDLLSFPTENPQMICNDADNVDLREVNFELTQGEQELLPEKYRHLPCYLLEIKEKGNGTPKTNLDGFAFTGRAGGNPLVTNEAFRLTILTKMTDTEYVLLVKYEHEETYFDAVRILTYKDKDDICSAALDFGSEASQVFLDGDKANLNLRDAFCDITHSDKKQDYYQGRCNDAHPELFKSIYHIHREPASTYMGDLPMNNGKNTFVQTLLPVNYQNHGELALLPNLKLVELLVFNKKDTTTSITFKDVDPLICKTPTTTLAAGDANDGILRMILSNYLAVILYNKRTTENAKLERCLQFTLLVPNVYYQSKVAKLIKNLYEDFDLLKEKNKDLFHCWRGMEVNILSESDASYFGIIREKKIAGEVRGAYNLIIDAGKGTTDFSLLQQQGENLSSFACVYRAGIPASGHVLTYAVYRALQSFFGEMNLGKQFESIIEEAKDGKNTAHLITLVDMLEQQKIHFDEYNEEYIEEIRQSAKSVNSLEKLIALLEKMNKKEFAARIPNLEKYLKEEINELVTLIDEKLFTYAQEREIKFNYVFLSGRAFMLRIFREAVVDALKAKGFITDDNKVIYDPGLTKSACVRGALQGDSYKINFNSTMLGTPSIKEKYSTDSKFKQRLHNLFSSNKWKMASIDNDFFYQGICKGNVSNVVVDICGNNYPEGFNSPEDTYLYFVGDEYLIKHGNVSRGIKESKSQKENTPLIEKSLFPFEISTDPKLLNTRPTRETPAKQETTGGTATLDANVEPRHTEEKIVTETTGGSSLDD